MYGSVDMKVPGLNPEDSSIWAPASGFSMLDIYENRVSYQHGGSEQFKDNFTFVVSDGTNGMFMMQGDQPHGEASPPIATPQVSCFTYTNDEEHHFHTRSDAYSHVKHYDEFHECQEEVHNLQYHVLE